MKAFPWMMLFVLIAACGDPVETPVVEDLISAEGHQDVRAEFRPRSGRYRVFMFFRTRDSPPRSEVSFMIAGVFEILDEEGTVITRGAIHHEIRSSTRQLRAAEFSLSSEQANESHMFSLALVEGSDELSDHFGAVSVQVQRASDSIFFD